LEDEIRDKQIFKILFALRCKKEMTQEQIAQKIGGTQGKISKIENAYDKDLSMKDLKRYLIDILFLDFLRKFFIILNNLIV
jgi:transcriptional regulator with XRE-family HTH domain